MTTDYQALKTALREVLAEEMGFGRCEMTAKWEGGALVLRPGNQSLQDKEIPIEAFFKKITSVREKLRVLEQKLNNNAELSAGDRTEYQKLLSRAYGSLTTLNVLFSDEDDRFEGMKGQE
ncbi:MAG: hypothetical protein QGG73_04110 [Candidatus Hydrogenedentes bacterium]|jgi:hypothetical protein|nr:hypothetical protein [Candidatus Hydrogenedentota bacterium]